jgi:hypothetical protein
VVVDPDDSDDQKAHGVREVRRPLCSERVREPIGVRMRNRDLEDEKGDRYREDAVAERLHAVGGHGLRSVGRGLALAHAVDLLVLCASIQDLVSSRYRSAPSSHVKWPVSRMSSLL